MIPQRPRHKGATAHNPAMTQRNQSEAAHHRPRRIGERPDQDLDQDMQMIGIAIDKRQRDQRGAGNPGPEPAWRHERLAKRPAGLMNIMTMKKANAST